MSGVNHVAVECCTAPRTEVFFAAAYELKFGWMKRGTQRLISMSSEGQGSGGRVKRSRERFHANAINFYSRYQDVKGSPQSCLGRGEQLWGEFRFRTSASTMLRDFHQVIIRDTYAGLCRNERGAEVPLSAEL